MTESARQESERQAGTGGSAFPVIVPGSMFSVVEDRGLSARDWFAAHAPNEIPEWFVNEADEATRPAVVTLSHLSRDSLEYVRFAVDQGYGESDLSEEKKDLWPDVMKLSAYYDARDQWGRQQVTNRYFAWRFFFADQMLAARSTEQQGHWTQQGNDRDG